METMNWQPLGLSLQLAAVTTAGLLLLGLPLAAFLAHSKLRFKFLLEALVGLPLVLPPTVLGFYLLLLVAAGDFWRVVVRLFGRRINFFFLGVGIGLDVLQFAVYGATHPGRITKSTPFVARGGVYDGQRPLGGALAGVAAQYSSRTAHWNCADLCAYHRRLLWLFTIM